MAVARARKLHRLTLGGKTKAAALDAPRIEAVCRGLDAKAWSEPVVRLSLGWAAYVDRIASREDLARAGVEVGAPAAPPPAVRAPAAGVKALGPHWKRLCALVKERTKGPSSPLSALRPPALAEDVEAIEAWWKLRLPDDFVAFLALHDGGEGDIGGGPFPWGVMSLAQSSRQALLMVSTAKRMAGYAIEEEDEAVRAVYWHRAWWPFANSGGGDYKCIDLAPTKAGRAGQVIDWPHDDNRRTVEAPSFAAWIEGLVADLERGEYVVDGGAVVHWRYVRNAKPPKKRAPAKRARRGAEGAT